MNKLADIPEKSYATGSGVLKDLQVRGRSLRLGQ